MLESKAQASITVSGIFFAAAFAYARETAPLSECARTTLLGCLSALLLSVASALLALRVRQTSLAPQGTFVDGLVGDLLQLPDDRLTDESITRFGHDRIMQWKETVAATEAANRAKAKWVWASQMLLVAAMAGAALFTFMRVG